MTVQRESSLLAHLHARIEAFYDIDAWHWNEETDPFETCAGSILVQHTAWTNVEKALANLRAANAFSLEAIISAREDDLADLVRPAGTPLTKARRLQAFYVLAHNEGGLQAMLAKPVSELRPLLLRTRGIGPETADAIILYGARAPTIVHDAYTARFLRRIGLGPERDRYDDWRSWLAERLPLDGAYRRRHHAGIVIHCKTTCRARPLCGSCPLLLLCKYGRAGLD